MAEGLDTPRKVPLVRVDGFPYDTGMHASPQQLVADPRFLRSFKNRRTMVAEEVLGLGDCLYFYVGYACPRFGDMAFVYDPAMSAQWPGGATPFDTGGIIGYIHATDLPGKTLEEEKRQQPTRLSDEEKEIFRRYVESHRIDLHAWQGHFVAFLETEYDRSADYVSGVRPRGDDPTGRHLHPGNVREAWTWEIQAHRDHSVLEGLWLLRISVGQEQLLRDALEDRPKDDPWWLALEDTRIFSPSEAEWEKERICKDAERTILTWL